MRSGRPLFAPLSFELNAGDILILKGANGSGKTTLLRTLAGLIPAPAPLPTYPSPLYLGHTNALHGAMTVSEHLDFWRGISTSVSISNDTILKTLGLTGLESKQTRILSQGQKRRLSFARLLLHPAQLWLLDEPQAAQDKTGHAMLLNLIANHRAKSGTAIIASHEDLNIPDTKTLMIEGNV